MFPAWLSTSGFIVVTGCVLLCCPLVGCRPLLLHISSHVVVFACFLSVASSFSCSLPLEMCLVCSDVRFFFLFVWLCLPRLMFYVSYNPNQIVYIIQGSTLIPCGTRHVCQWMYLVEWHFMSHIVSPFLSSRVTLSPRRSPSSPSHLN